MTPPHSKQSIVRSSLRRGLPRVQAIWIIRGFLLIAFGLAWFTLAPVPKAFGVTPAPDGAYPGGNTAEGLDALFNRTTGTWNTALGYNALYHDTTGNSNTAVGFNALLN